MLTQICQYLRNWFDKTPSGADLPKYYGLFKVEGGALTFSDGTTLPLVDGQYYRLMGSRFSDGVRIWGDVSDILADEPAFSGAVWDMRVPPEIVDLAAEVEAWSAKYAGADSAAMSPYTSESFGPGGYSYSKSSGASADGVGATVSGSWQSAFAAQLSSWRKV